MTQETPKAPNKFFRWFKGNSAQTSESDKPKEESSEQVLTNLPEIQVKPVMAEALVSDDKASMVAIEEEGTLSLPEPIKKTGFFSKLKQGLHKTREKMGGGLATLVLGSKKIDEDLLEELESQLIMADVGVQTTQKIMGNLTKQVARKELANPDALWRALKRELSGLLENVDQPLIIDTTQKPYVILMVGVNGVGKTTTIGKLAKRYQQQGLSVMLAAGDTFRAAAVEQLQVWGERNHITVVAQHTGADSASVLFDAMQSAQAKGVDVLIADTAGRLHTKSNLMEELIKVKRVMQKLDAAVPHETLLVLDAGTGQNALNQVEHFHKAVGLTGLALTKLDGTAKGGVLFSLADKFAIPIRFIGVGEGIDDLRPFDSKQFIEALFDQETNTQESIES